MSGSTEIAKVWLSRQTENRETHHSNSELSKGNKTRDTNVRIITIDQFISN